MVNYRFKFKSCRPWPQVLIPKRAAPACAPETTPKPADSNRYRCD